MSAVNNSARLLYLSYTPDLSTWVAGIIPEFLTRGLIRKTEEANNPQLVREDIKSHALYSWLLKTSIWPWLWGMMLAVWITPSQMPIALVGFLGSFLHHDQLAQWMDWPDWNDGEAFIFHLIDLHTLLCAPNFLQLCPLPSTSCLFLRILLMVSNCFLDASALWNKFEPRWLRAEEEANDAGYWVIECQLSCLLHFFLCCVIINCFK